MITTNQTLLLVLLGALCLSTANAASTLRYSYSFSQLNSAYYPMWDLGILQAGWTIRVSVTLPNDPSTSSTILADTIKNGFLALSYLDNSNPSKIQYVPAVNSKGTFTFNPPAIGATSFSGTYTIYFPPGYSGTSSNFLLTYIGQLAPQSLLSTSVLTYVNIQVNYFNGTGYSVGSGSPVQTLLKVTETGRNDVVKVIYVASTSPAF